MTCFEYLPDCRILVCKECRYGVLQSRQSSHLRDIHKLKPSRRRAILAQEQYESSVQTEEEAFLGDEVPLPFAQLAPPVTNGFACQPESGEKCLEHFVCTTLRGIRGHCAGKHGWENTLKRGQRVSNGRKQNDPTRPWRTGVHCQYFWKRGDGGKWFEVQAITQEQFASGPDQLDIENLQS